MKTIYRTICAICVICGLTACSDFLEEQVPQATLRGYERIVLTLELRHTKRRRIRWRFRLL